MMSEIKVTFDIQPIADSMGISKEFCAELLAVELTRLLFPEPQPSEFLRSMGLGKLD